MDGNSEEEEFSFSSYVKRVPIKKASIKGKKQAKKDAKPESETSTNSENSDDDDEVDRSDEIVSFVNKPKNSSKRRKLPSSDADGPSLSQQIKIPEIDQKTIELIVLNEYGKIENPEIIKIDEDNLEELIKEYELTQEEKDKIKNEVENMISRDDSPNPIPDSEIEIPKDKLDEINKDFEKKKKEIEKEIQQKREEQEQINTQLKSLFDDVLKAKDDLKDEKKTQIQEIEKKNQETRNEISKIDEQLSNANEHFNELKEYESVDISDIQTQIADMENVANDKLNKEREYLHKTNSKIFDLIDDVWSLFDKAEIRDTGIEKPSLSEGKEPIDILKDIKDATERALDSLLK
ncbi:hypothetical protein M9Y10_038879 [Tritrichomonas musculus]|uniref:Uncharacterized protein n=1 Tax=Tritrichomonas musculus TaxID=1915356 RepID=A0ABR2KBG7_9EUKA